jgi:hypothetical protein
MARRAVARMQKTYTRQKPADPARSGDSRFLPTCAMPSPFALLRRSDLSTAVFTFRLPFSLSKFVAGW